MTNKNHYLQKKHKDLRNIEYIVRLQHSIQIVSSSIHKINSSQIMRLSTSLEPKTQSYKVKTMISN